MIKFSEEYTLTVSPADIAVNGVNSPVYQIRSNGGPHPGLLLAVVYENARGWHGAAGTAWVTASREECLIWAIDRAPEVATTFEALEPLRRQTGMTA